MTAKYGGIALRSGLITYGAQNLCSLAKSAKNVDKIVGGREVIAIAQRDTSLWLEKARDEKTDIDKSMREVQGGGASPRNDNDNALGRVNCHYSLARLCELLEPKRVKALTSKKEKVHIEAQSGQHHLWITQLPLSFKKYALTSPGWRTAARKKLMVNVFPFHSHCAFCKGGW